METRYILHGLTQQNMYIKEVGTNHAPSPFPLREASKNDYSSEPPGVGRPNQDQLGFMGALLGSLCIINRPGSGCGRLSCQGRQ